MTRTYISLFSSAGVGCYGFKMKGFECIASNELLKARLDVQRVNHKCKYDSGYICGDATSPDTHKKILDEISFWKEKEGLRQIDVVFATPPCQGMSTANYKKNNHEQVRNSLVVEAIKMINIIHPRVFVFENVRAFMKSICTDISGDDMPIKDSIYKNLSPEYNIYWKVINFKDYGVPSSRPRTIVIGTSKGLSYVSPLLLLPTRSQRMLLKDCIGKYSRLRYCEKDKKDPFHFARPFPEYMLPWIKDLKEGETAFDNPDETKPYSIDAKGNRVINKGSYMGNKYRRLIWNRPGACIATRSDVMSSQDTIHPCDNRVLSIRELMTLMTIPDSFQWTDHDDKLTVENSDQYLKENEGNIRRCIGEAVPTLIGATIAEKIAQLLDYEDEQNEELPRKRKKNFYIDAARQGYTIQPHKAFDEIMSFDSEREEIDIKVLSPVDFFNYVPQLASYYSHANRISVDVESFTKEEKVAIRQLLKETSLGSRLSISYDRLYETLQSYDILIENGACHFNKKPIKNTKQFDGSGTQLTLF